MVYKIKSSNNLATMVLKSNALSKPRLNITFDFRKAILSKPHRKNIQNNQIWAYLLILIILILITTFKIEFSIFSSMFLDFPLLPSILFILAIIGYLTHQEILYGLAIVGMLPSFLLCGLSLIYHQNNFIVINLLNTLLGVIIFSKNVKILSQSICVIDALIYIYFRFYAGFILSLESFDRMNNIWANMILVSSPLVMILFNYLKHNDRTSYKYQITLLNDSYFEKKLLRLNISKKSFETLPYSTLILSGLICALIRYQLSNSIVLACTLSFWSFFAAIVCLLFQNIFLNTWVFAVSSPILFLLYCDLSKISIELGWILNIVAHLIIVIIGFIKFFQKGRIRWDFYLCYGLLILLYAFILNYYFPFYLGENAPSMVFFVFGEEIVLSVVLFSKNQKLIAKSPRIGKKYSLISYIDKFRVRD